MITLALAVTNLLLYSLGTTLQTLVLRGRLTYHRGRTLCIGAAAAASHAVIAWRIVGDPNGLDLGFFPVSVLISLLMVSITLALLWRKPLQSLLVFLYPLAALTVLAGLNDEGISKPFNPDPGVLTHVALSVTAYSLFTLAGCQSILVYIQNRALKQSHNSMLIRHLPPLQTMEALLFELLRAGLILLTLAIFTGLFFIEDLFAQHLAHKTLFSLLSWCVFAALLIGRQTLGWRGVIAIRWTLTGYALLMLGYYGSKFALEFIFQRGSGA